MGEKGFCGPFHKHFTSELLVYFHVNFPPLLLLITCRAGRHFHVGGKWLRMVQHMQAIGALSVWVIISTSFPSTQNIFSPTFSLLSFSRRALVGGIIRRITGCLGRRRRAKGFHARLKQTRLMSAFLLLLTPSSRNRSQIGRQTKQRVRPEGGRHTESGEEAKSHFLNPTYSTVNSVDYGTLHLVSIQRESLKNNPGSNVWMCTCTTCVGASSPPSPSRRALTHGLMLDDDDDDDDALRG